MKVRLLIPFNGLGASWAEGDIAELPSGVARSLIASRQAEPAADPEPAAVAPRAAIETAEAAALPERAAPAKPKRKGQKP